MLPLKKIAFINAGYIFQHHPDRQAVVDKLDAEPVAEKLAASKKEVDDKLLLLVKSRSKSCGFKKKMHLAYVKLIFKTPTGN